mmetsp:Transcript_31100/g.37650  ORF Transcript_31100/g.37650 Transcript_31100/m.37650 type:complete len:154 (+) Transcript_31100:117-578(+)
MTLELMGSVAKVTHRDNDTQTEETDSRVENSSQILSRNFADSERKCSTANTEISEGESALGVKPASGEMTASTTGEMTASTTGEITASTKELSNGLSSIQEGAITYVNIAAKKYAKGEDVKGEFLSMVNEDLKQMFGLGEDSSDEDSSDEENL